MIDFKSIRIPVFLSAKMGHDNYGFISFDEGEGELAACDFFINASRCNVLHNQLRHYFNRINGGYHDFVNDFNKNGYETAWTNLTERHKELTQKNGSVDLGFPENLPREKAIMTDIEICSLHTSMLNTTYRVPADIEALSRAFTISAHTGALVSIKVDTNNATSRIETRLPHPNESQAKPSVRMK